MSTDLVELPQGRLARPSLSPQLLTWDKGLEELVLGCLLLGNPNLAGVVTMIQPTDFYLRSHQKIFAAIRDLHAENLPVDPFTVSDRLQEDEDFQEVGGRNRLLVLAQLPVAVADARHYAEILKRNSIDRAASALAEQYLLGKLDLTLLYQGLGLLAQETTGVSPILSVGDLYERTPPEPPWIVKGLLAREAVTDLAAKIKLGKTHFALSMIASILAGRDFLGFATVKTNVLYLTEERQSTFTAACRRVGIPSDSGFHVLLRSQAPRDWVSTGALVLKEARRLEVGLVAVDTLSDWAGLGADEENDAGAALAAMRPLQALAGAGVGVLALRHDRKGTSADLADSARGSSAFGGAADILLGLRPPAGAGHSNRRRLMGRGRLDGIPQELTVELVDGQYYSLGTSAQVEKDKAREIILALLPEDESEALPEKHLLAQAGHETSRSTLKRALAGLVCEGVASRAKGVGTANSRAFGFWKTGGQS